jgi:hypothetical protein
MGEPREKLVSLSRHKSRFLGGIRPGFVGFDAISGVPGAIGF